MRDFLVYAASAHNPVYGAAVMMMQGLGQIALMVVLLLALVYGFGSVLTRWVATRPHQVGLVSALALVAGGTFFVYYWGFALTFDIGQWGFKFGIYGSHDTRRDATHQRLAYSQRFADTAPK